MPLGDLSVPLLRQRARLADALATLDDEQWAAPTRCDAWSVREVIAHLVGTNQFWAISISSGLAGAPTRFLATFDPVSTPPQLVDGLRSMTPAQVLEGFVESNGAIAAALDGLDEAGWDTQAESPPGHVAIRALVLHALWDSWIHERDVLLPLGVTPVEEPDEITASLTYAAALGLALQASAGSTRLGALAVDATDPDIKLVVEAGPTVVVCDGEPPDDAARLTGSAVGLVESLSFRAPFEHELPAEDQWMLRGLAEVFDVVS